MSCTHWTRSQKLYLGVKRCLGIFLVLILLPPSLLMILCYAIAIKIEDGGPVFFRQERIGKDGRVFQLLKLRSMRVNSEHSGTGVYSKKDDPRVLRVGAFARRTSLDELPQMINILKGEMAWVGPRPPLTYHPWPIEQYTAEQRHMFDVRPGITGWAQVNGRKTVEWHKRIEMNVWYARNLSFLLDLRIAFMTVFKVLRNTDNANAEETLRPEELKG